MVYANKSNLKGFNANWTNNYEILINEALTKRRSNSLKTDSGPKQVRKGVLDDWREDFR